MINKLSKLFLVTIVLGIFLFGFVAAVEPFGANVTAVDTSRSDPLNYPAGTHEAWAGNVTELTIEGVSVTQSWQGYYGNVSGTIILADSDEYRMYDWSLANPEGEVYASPSGSISWADVQCYSKDLDSVLGDAYGIAVDDVDRVSNTFSVGGTHEKGGGFVHDTFYTANIEFATGTCASTHLFTAGGVVTSGTFQEVLLEDAVTTDGDEHVIFVSILDEERPDGFNGKQSIYNFQMLVLEDGHTTNAIHTTYYFWVELE